MALISPYDKVHRFIFILVNRLYCAGKLLDDFIKQIKILNKTYERFMWVKIQFLIANDNFIVFFIFTCVYLPKILLLLCLIIDIFFFNKISHFYQIIFIGFIPLLYKYLFFSIEMHVETQIQSLEKFYAKVIIFEKNYEYDSSHINQTKAVHHFSVVFIRDFINIKFENFVNYSLETINYEYIGVPTLSEHFLQVIADEHYNGNIKLITSDEKNKLKEIFEILISKIIENKIILDLFQDNLERPFFKNIKLCILCCYLICSMFLLMQNYTNIPIKFETSQLILNTIFANIVPLYENPFS